MCQFVSSISSFSPLSKLAGRAIYFASVYLYFLNLFNGLLSRIGCWKTNGPIFIKISELVNWWKFLLTWYIILQSLKGCCHGNQLKSQYRRFSWITLVCCSAIPKQIAISQFQFQKVQWHEFLCIVTNFDEIRSSNPRVYAVNNYTTRQQKLAYHATYLRLS